MGPAIYARILSPRRRRHWQCLRLLGLLGLLGRSDVNDCKVAASTEPLREVEGACYCDLTALWRCFQLLSAPVSSWPRWRGASPLQKRAACSKLLDGWIHWITSAYLLRNVISRKLQRTTLESATIEREIGEDEANFGLPRYTYIGVWYAKESFDLSRRRQELCPALPAPNPEGQRTQGYCHCSICRRLSGAPFSCQALLEI